MYPRQLLPVALVRRRTRANVATSLTFAAYRLRSGKRHTSRRLLSGWGAVRARESAAASVRSVTGMWEPGTIIASAGSMGRGW